MPTSSARRVGLVATSCPSAAPGPPAGAAGAGGMATGAGAGCVAGPHPPSTASAAAVAAARARLANAPTSPPRRKLPHHLGRLDAQVGRTAAAGAPLELDLRLCRSEAGLVAAFETGTECGPHGCGSLQPIAGERERTQVEGQRRFPLREEARGYEDTDRR